MSINDEREREIFFVTIYNIELKFKHLCLKFFQMEKKNIVN